MVSMNPRNENTIFDGTIIVERIDLLGFRSFTDLELEFS